MIEDTIYYSSPKNINSHIIDIVNQTEICQGGPVVGELHINGKKLSEKDFFGGPFVEYAGSVYLPKREKSLFFSGFRLCSVNLQTMKLINHELKLPLIHITRIENEVLYYLDCVEGREEKKFPIN